MSDATNNLAVAEQFAKVTRQGDVAGYIAMAEEDAVTWHNFDCTEVNRDRSAETLRWLHLTSPDVTWTDVALTMTSRGFVWQAEIVGTGSGGPFRSHTCMVVTLSSRYLISRVEEYLDPASLRAIGRRSEDSPR